MGDIDFWKSELDKKLGELKEHLDELDSQHIRVRQALAACDEPLSISEQCLAHRNQRQGIDRCDDNVQKHLGLEVETLQKSGALLRQTSLQSEVITSFVLFWWVMAQHGTALCGAEPCRAITHSKQKRNPRKPHFEFWYTFQEEIRQMKKTKYNIEKDLVDKEAAMNIDNETSHLKVTGPKKKSRETRYAVSKAKDSFTPSAWQENTEQNLEWANGQIKACLALQAQVDTVLAHVASHLRSQKDLTDRAFDRRIDEVKNAKLLLEKQLSETVVKINEMDESIRSVERAIAAKQGPLATCQQKIQQRKQRPNIEHVSDAVEAQLHTEAAHLIDTINKLEECLARNKSSYAALVKTKLELEAQIDVKANSVFIDEVKCMTIRRGMNMQAY